MYSIVFASICFLSYAIVFGLSYAFDCEFLPNRELMLILQCGYWMHFAASSEILCLVASAVCSIVAIIMFRCHQNEPGLSAAQKHKEWRLISISFTEWLFAAISRAFYQGYTLRLIAEPIGESAYLLYWVYPKYAKLAFVCLVAVTYLCWSFELRKSILVNFGWKPTAIRQPEQVGLIDQSRSRSTTNELRSGIRLQPRESTVLF